MRRTLSLLAVTAALVACSESLPVEPDDSSSDDSKAPEDDSSEDDSSEPEPEPEPEPVETLSTDASLVALTPSHGALIPGFDPERTSYIWRVPTGSDNVTLTPTAGSDKAQVTVTGLSLPEAGATAQVLVTVTSEDRSQETTVTLNLKLVPAAESRTIRAIGDSTMAQYDPKTDPGQRGWGQEFTRFLSEEVVFDNRALDGVSTKSYLTQGLWAVTMTTLRMGDTLLIQFGHNDEKDDGVEGESGRGTAAYGAYKDNLELFVKEARAVGANPVLLTPVVRLGWTGEALSAVAAHDLTGNGTTVGSGNYPEAMREVAEALACPLVDLTEATRQLVESLGPTDAKTAFYISEDDTHLNPLGATAYAQLAAEGLLALGLFEDALDPTFHLGTSLPSITWTSTAVNTPSDQEVLIYGLDLADVTSVTVTAPEGYLLSTPEGDTFGASVDLPVSGTFLYPTPVLVRFLPTLAQEYPGLLQLNAGALSTTLPLVGVGIDQ